MDEVKRLTHSNEDPRIICIRKDLHHIITEEKKIFFKETISNDKSLPPKYNPKFVQDREDKIQVQMKKIETLILQIENSAVLNEIMDYQKEGMNILRRHTDPRMIVLRECLLAVIASKSDQDLN